MVATDTVAIEYCEWLPWERLLSGKVDSDW